MGVLPERPVRAAELYDRAVYGSNVRRAVSESMQDYCARRRTEFEDLTKISPETGVSDDLRGYMLLRFSGLSKSEQSQVVASSGNSYELDRIERALRLQHRRLPAPRPEEDFRGVMNGRTCDQIT